MANKTKLKLCPFCGEIKRVVECPTEDLDRSVQCMNCWATGPIEETKKKAVEAWNRPARKKG